MLLNLRGGCGGKGGRVLAGPSSMPRVLFSKALRTFDGVCGGSLTNHKAY
jgi:hypothetical protein